MIEVRDVGLALGAASLVGGTAWLSLPVGLIVLGVLLMGFALLLPSREDK